jgi:hypothetical protein
MDQRQTETVPSASQQEPPCQQGWRLQEMLQMLALEETL